MREVSNEKVIILLCCIFLLSMNLGVAQSPSSIDIKVTATIDTESTYETGPQGFHFHSHGQQTHVGN